MMLDYAVSKRIHTHIITFGFWYNITRKKFWSCIGSGTCAPSIVIFDVVLYRFSRDITKATECLVPSMRSKSLENVPVKKIGSEQASNDVRPLHACLSEQYTRVKSMSPVNIILNCYLSFYISLPLWITTPIFFYGDQVLYIIFKLSTYFNFYGKMV